MNSMKTMTLMTHKDLKRFDKFQYHRVEDSHLSQVRILMVPKNKLYLPPSLRVQKRPKTYNHLKRILKAKISQLMKEVLL